MLARLDSFIVIVSRIGRCVGPILLLFSSLQAATTKHGQHRHSKTLTKLPNLKIITEDSTKLLLKKQNAINTIETQLEESNNQVNELKNVLNEIGNKNIQLETNLGNITAERDDLNQQLVSLKEENRIVKEELTTLSNELKNTKDDLQQSKEDMKLLQLNSSQCADKADEYDSLYGNYQMLENLYKKLKKDHEKLLKKHEKVETEQKEVATALEKQKRLSLIKTKKITELEKEKVPLKNNFYNRQNNLAIGDNTDKQVVNENELSFDSGINTLLWGRQPTQRIDATSPDVKKRKDSNTSIINGNNQMDLFTELDNISLVDIMSSDGQNSNEQYGDEMPYLFNNEDVFIDEQKKTNQQLIQEKQDIINKYNNLQAENTKLKEEYDGLATKVNTNSADRLPKSSEKGDRENNPSVTIALSIFAGIGVGSLFVELFIMPIIKYAHYTSRKKTSSRLARESSKGSPQPTKQKQVRKTAK